MAAQGRATAGMTNRYHLLNHNKGGMYSDLAVDIFTQIMKLLHLAYPVWH